MDRRQQEDPDPDTVMSREQDVTQAEDTVDSRTTYKSFKKKYRKMRIKFDEAMRQARELYLDEQRAVKLSKKLALGNDQIMDLLLDMNDTPQIPIDKRINLKITSPSLSAVPSLISDDELARASEVQTVAGQAMYDELRTMLDERAAAQPHASWTPEKSLASLMATTPHLSLANPHVPQQLVSSLEKDTYSYLTLDQLDDQLYDIDASLGTVPSLPRANAQPSGATQDFSFDYPYSSYNWLRENVPKIFLQDAENSNEKDSKAHTKSSSSRGAGKRSSIAAAPPSSDAALEIVEENGHGYEPPLHPVKKRKRDLDDDVGYHPKRGTFDENKVKKPRQARKRKSDGLEGEEKEEKRVKEKPASTRKRKVKAESPAAYPEEGHPFGPFRSFRSPFAPSSRG